MQFGIVNTYHKSLDLLEILSKHGFLVKEKFIPQEFIKWGVSCKTTDKIHSELTQVTFQILNRWRKYYEFACRNGREKINLLL